MAISFELSRFARMIMTSVSVYAAAHYLHALGVPLEVARLILL